MSEHYDFHYQPTGSGAISGQQVLQQTEDAINELGDYVNDNVGGAMDVAQQALETAQNAETNAQTALDTANSFSSAIQSAQQDASTALSTAQTAQTTASNANNTAIQAQQDASSAVTTANNASGQVSTLSGTVTALGQRVTTAEGNIGQNTSDISALTTRVGTAEGNITTLQNDVSIAQGNASSAIATAGTVKQQAYVLRYSSSSVTDNSTIAYSTLDNTDNIKASDKVIDVDGKIFSVVSVDTANSTFTVGSALVDLALDANVVHTSGNETVDGQKTFTNTIKSQKEIEITGSRLAYILPEFSAGYSGLSLCTYASNGAVKIGSWKVDDNDNTKHVLDASLGYLNISTGAVNSVNRVFLTPRNSTNSKLGDSVNKWQEINGVEPSSLSLPSGNLNDIIDISSYLTYLDGSSANTYIAPANGWISITMGNCSGIKAYITGLWGHQIVRPTVGGVRFLMPILKDKTANILIFGGTIDNARFIPCQGNV